MAGQRVLYGGGGGGCSSIDSALLPNQRLPCKEPADSLFVSASASPLLGSRTMVSFQDVNRGNRLERSFFSSFDQVENGDDDLDEYLHQPEKKRRLTVEQVQFLEKSFEVENKLEPERKIQLAKELGLQPRQIAIWFQNRRARWKNKQLEKDYDILQTSYNNLKADYETLLKEKEQLKEEVLVLTDKLLEKENKERSLNMSEDLKVLKALPKEALADLVPEDQLSKGSALAFKQEDGSSAKSDVVDSDSPHYTDGVHSSLVERVDSSYFEHDQSDLSQDEEDNFSNTLLPPSNGVPKLENADYLNPLPNSSYFGLAVEDHNFCFWSF